MKKNIWLITGILFACLLVNVKADYIVTPNDEFFRSHEDEIDTWGYWHKSEKDIAIVPYPGSEEIIGVVEEDRVIRVLFLYEDAQGELWGAQGTVDQGLWFKMKYLPKFYANIDFWMEHQEEFNNKGKKQIYYEDDAWLVVWEYPGSDHISYTLPTSITRDKQYPLYEGAEYIDKHGVRWTSISYMGVSGWLNTEAMISDIKPEVQSVWLTLDENFDPSQYDFSESFFDLHGKKILTGILVTGVCVLTGVLVYLKKKRTEITVQND